MRRRAFPWLGCLAVALFCNAPAGAQAAASPASAPCRDPAGLENLSPALRSPASDTSWEAIASTLRAVDGRQFPELDERKIRVGKFASGSDYFRTRFSVARFLFFLPMRYSVQVNPELFGRNAPPEGVCAILGHESAHLVTLSHGNRIRRFPLLGLLFKSYTARFERRADLEAIRRGFAPGLQLYREWVYRNIPPKRLAAKKRNYFSPEEITAIAELGAANPALFSLWQHHIPRNLQEIRDSAAAAPVRANP